jgi:hypothetical protein
VLINDLVEEATHVRSLPGLRYGASFRRRVLAHSELNRVGTFISDYASLSLLDSPGRASSSVRPRWRRRWAPVRHGIWWLLARLGLDHEPVAASGGRVYGGILHVGGGAA